MTTIKHTDIPFSAVATAALINAPLGQLDQAIANFGIDAKADFGILANGSDETAKLTSMFAAVPAGGGTVIMPAGIYGASGDVVIPVDNTRIVTAGRATQMLALAAGVKLLKATGRTGLHIGPIFLDGAWAANGSGIYLDGCQQTVMEHVWADRFTGTGAAVNFQGSTRNCSRNILWALQVQNALRGLIFNGSAAFPTANNIIGHAYINGQSSALSTLIDFQNYTDSNLFLQADLGLNFTGSIGVLYNSGVPGSINGVYENHFLKLMVNAPAGQTGVVVNKTDRISYIQIRPSGGGTAVTVNAGGLIGYLPGSRTMADVEQATLGGAAALVGFYGHAPVAQPAAPVTLADVIAIIRGNGLSA